MKNKKENLTTDPKKQSFEDVLSSMNEEALQWLLNHLAATRALVEAVKHPETADKDELDFSLEWIESNISELQKWLDEELFNRLNRLNTLTKPRYN